MGYRLYQGGESQIYTNVVDVGSADTTTITGLVPDGTYYFAVTAYDDTGLESTFSGEISYTVPSNASLPPVLVANLGLTVNAFGQAMVSGTAPVGYVYAVLVTDNFGSWTSGPSQPMRPVPCNSPIPSAPSTQTSFIASSKSQRKALIRATQRVLPRRLPARRVFEPGAPKH
jgi:hypothetical protein